MINSISPLQLKKFLSDGQEIALFDVREHGQYFLLAHYPLAGLNLILVD